MSWLLSAHSNHGMAVVSIALDSLLAFVICVIAFLWWCRSQQVVSVALDSLHAVVICVIAFLWWGRSQQHKRQVVDKGVQGPITYRNSKYQPLAEHAWGAW